MDENMIGAAEINSIAYLSKKRKTQTELQETPLTKHVCCGKKLEHDSSSDSSTEQKKVRSSIFTRDESIPENAEDSYSFHSNQDSVMSYFSSYPKTSASFKASTPSGSRNDNYCEIGLYSLESRSLTKASLCKSESLSIHEEEEELDRDYGLHPSDNYEDHFLEFGNHADCSCSEYQTDKDLDEMLYSNGVSPSNYVPSSGRWPVNQDAQKGNMKPTIDKEFEEYFSMLML